MEMKRRHIAFVVGLWVLASGIESRLNLFMNETETKRLLGIPGELYYIRDGAINDYALTFVLPVKADIHDIYFDWQSLHDSPNEPKIPYSVALHVSNPAPLDQAVFSIPREGSVPTQPSVFYVTLRCTGLVNAEVDVRLQLNFTIPYSANLTSLDIRRKKICLKGGSTSVLEVEEALEEIIQPDSSTSLIVWPLPTDERKSLGGEVFYIGLGCAGGATFILIFVLSVVFCRTSRSTRKTPHAHTTRKMTLCRPSAPYQPDKVYFRCDTPSNNSYISGGTSIYRGPGSFDYSDLMPEDVTDILSELYVDRNCVTLMDVILEGAFGRVHRGVARMNTNGFPSERQVLVKTVAARAPGCQLDAMLKEACLTKGILHDGIASVVGVCPAGPAPLGAPPEACPYPPLVIYLDSNDGNLKQYLQHCRLSDNALNAIQLTYMAVQIVRGVHYLHRRRILHRDIATRNCLVDFQLRARITDSCLSRDLFPLDYACVGGDGGRGAGEVGGSRPVRWLAPEALIDRQYSTASDMWSFGVLLWELFTLGLQPYADIEERDMSNCLQEGCRLQQPLNCPNAVFSLMSCCWRLMPDDRPKFAQMQASLQDFYSTLAGFV